MSASPRIGVWGTFDLENFGDMLYPRIVRRELSERLPDASVRVFAPFGYAGLNRFDAGEPAEPLGRWSEQRTAELAAELDCVIVGGGEIVHDHDELLAPHYGVGADEMIDRAPSRFFIDGLGPTLEGECPVVWNAIGVPFDATPEQAERFRAALASRPYVAVRDELSRQRLVDAGVEREIEVVPDPAFLLDRLYPRWLLEKRIDFLRSIDRYPEQGTAIVVQANTDYVSHAAAIAEQLAGIAADRDDCTVVLAETGPCHGDGVFAGALERELPARVIRLGTAGLEDLAAAIAYSGGFIGSSLHGNIAAVVFGKPQVVLNAAGQSKLDGFGRLVENADGVVDKPERIRKAFEYAATLGPRDELRRELQRRVDEHFDRIAEIAGEAAARRGKAVASAGQARPSPEDQSLRTAYEALSARLAAQREALADQIDDLRAEIAAMQRELERSREDVREARERAAAKEQEVRTLLGTKTYRYTAPFRNAYAWLRGRRKQR